MRVSILHSDISETASIDEHETMLQVDAVHNVLEKLGCNVDTLAFNLDFESVRKKLHHHAPDIVFNLVESIEGKVDYVYLAPLLLEGLNIAYTGGSSKNILMTTDKLLTKYCLQTANLPTPEWINSPEDVDEKHFEQRKYIIKSVCEDASFGISQDSVVSDLATFQHIMHDRYQRLGGRWFAERYISGREFNLAFINTENNFIFLSVAEMKFDNLPSDILPIIDYETKWCVDVERYHLIQRSFNLDNDFHLINSMKECAIQCCKLFELIGYYRIDVRVDENGNFWIIEINANPSIAPDAGFPAQAKQSGFSYKTMIERILVKKAYASNS